VLLYRYWSRKEVAITVEEEEKTMGGENLPKEEEERGKKKKEDLEGSGDILPSSKLLTAVHVHTDAHTRVTYASS
jgi:hypothetical protein